MLEVENLICDYLEEGGRTVRGLTLPLFRMGEGEAWGVEGPSGSGKTTLFHCLAGLLTPSRGRIVLDGVELTGLSEPERARWRGKNLGYVFQEPKLLPFLTLEENIRLSGRLAGKEVSVQEIRELLTEVDLPGCGKRFPRQLSGGERQRAAFVRAIVRQPRLLLADEPTSSLDAGNSRKILDLLLGYQAQSGCLLLCASHDPAVQARFVRKLELRKEEA
ncbi:ATP-binding cassette domain-containing protein [Acidaminococcus fermentans]|uniref:ABC transporter ATP-binding protein n=1 Tax=Acidaminococcus fermentans TaxID=905 RepID=UPI00242A5943|nr:ATP-binding cassette domain-containing protein [Acidaminococcus fermentans]